MNDTIDTSETKSNSKSKNTARRIYDWVDPKAEVLKTILQLLIGTYIFTSLLLKGFWFLFPDSAPGPSAWVFFACICKLSTLKIISEAMLASAAVELGYMLFTRGPDEAIDPLIIATTGSALLVLSVTQEEPLGSAYFEDAIVVLLFVAALLCLFYLRYKCRKWFPDEMGNEKASQNESCGDEERKSMLPNNTNSADT